MSKFGFYPSRHVGQHFQVDLYGRRRSGESFQLDRRRRLVVSDSQPGNLGGKRSARHPAGSARSEARLATKRPTMTRSNDLPGGRKSALPAKTGSVLLRPPGTPRPRLARKFVSPATSRRDRGTSPLPFQKHEDHASSLRNPLPIPSPRDRLRSCRYGQAPRRGPTHEAGRFRNQPGRHSGWSERVLPD